MIDWNSITPENFEEMCTQILYKNNYHNINRIGGSGDRGRDIKAHKKVTVLGQIERDEVWIAQCKRYLSKPPTVGDLKDTLDWSIAHKPQGVLFFIANNLTSGTHDWLEAAKSSYNLDIQIVDIDYLEKELMRDTQLFKQFFGSTRHDTDEWYGHLVGPRTHDLIIYTAGEMPEDASRGAIADWRKNIENCVSAKNMSVEFFHPEFMGCDHCGIDANETVSMDTYMLQKSDALIAYLNKEELYGTITEIMLAHKYNKKIAIFVDEGLIYNINDIAGCDCEEVVRGEKSIDDGTNIYQKIFKTKHFCTCSLFGDFSKYWFMLNFLSQSDKGIIIESVNGHNYTSKMSSIIDEWLTCPFA